ncbi:MAG: hypothetical protein Q3997_01625 [Propionibacteriaceae bacterium]|nr:hypothetical protein [Propionibacteriaceae bacterium]
MNGYLLLALELAAILLVCVVLAFLAGRALGKRAGRLSQAQPPVVPSPGSDGPAPKLPVLPELYEPPARPSVPGLVDLAGDATALPPSLEQTHPVTHQPSLADAGEETVTRADLNEETVNRASLDDGKQADRPAAAEAGNAAAARIKELEEKLRKQEIEMARLETGATTAWDTTMPQLLGRIESLEQELRQARDESHQLQNLLEIERGRAAEGGRAAEEGWPSTPAE